MNSKSFRCSKIKDLWLFHKNFSCHLGPECVENIFSNSLRKTCHQRKLKHHSHNLQIKTCLCLPLEIKYCGNQIYNFFILKKQSANYFLYFGSNHSPWNFQHTFQHYLCQKLSFSIYLERCFFCFKVLVTFSNQTW